MPRQILVLEDNPERVAAMRECLEDRFCQFTILFFGDAATMVCHLETHLGSAAIICLDHDLELRPGPNGTMIDPGTGREVADCLARRVPVCPVIIHTSNANAAVGMEEVLREANWTTRRVIPFDDLGWIPGPWFRAVRRALVGPARAAAPPGRDSAG